MTIGDLQSEILTLSLAPGAPHRVIIEELSGVPTTTCSSHAGFLKIAPSADPAAVFLHRDFDGTGRGLNFLTGICATFPRTPIVVLAPAGDYRAMTQALALGAADFIGFPLVSEEVIARLFKRIADAKRPALAQGTLNFGDLELTPAARQVACNGRRTQMPPVTFSILSKLAEPGGIPQSRLDLIAAGWRGRVVSGNSLDQKIGQIRHSLHELESRMKVKAIYGVGFQLVDDKMAG
jgi:DNA-binding response OmpR family regulator